MPQDILQHATKLYVCKSVKQKDQFGPIQGVLKMGTKVSLLEPKCMDLIFAIEVVHKPRGKVFGYFWSLRGHFYWIKLIKNNMVIRLTPIPLNCPRGLWMSPYNQRLQTIFSFGMILKIWRKGGKRVAVLFYEGMFQNVYWGLFWGYITFHTNIWILASFIHLFVNS